MIITVENLGPISHASIDLNADMIIFSGQNNTGKTYLANVIYALEKAELDFSELDFDRHYYPNDPDEDDIELNGGEFRLEDFVEENQAAIVSSFEQSVLQDLPRILNMPEDRFANTNLLLKPDDKFWDGMFSSKVSFRISSPKYGGWVRLRKLGESKFINLQFIGNSFTPDTKEINRFFSKFFVRLINRVRFPEIFPLLAERQGISIFHQELAAGRDQLLKDIVLSEGEELTRSIDFSKRVLYKYPLSIQNTLKLTDQFSLWKNEEGPYAEIATQFENELLNGQIKLDAHSSGLEYIPAGSKHSLNLSNSSSTVKSLSLLVFYLRRIARKGEVLLFDEPELNLHPDNQIVLANLLGRLVKNGLKVIISTHSPYIIRELSNLILLHRASQNKTPGIEEIITKHNIPDDALLDEQKVKAYLFTRGKPVQSLEIGEFGIQVITIDQAAEHLDEISESIYFATEDI